MKLIGCVSDHSENQHLYFNISLISLLLPGEYDSTGAGCHTLSVSTNPTFQNLQKSLYYEISEVLSHPHR